jgi:hypothetical protein
MFLQLFEAVPYRDYVCYRLRCDFRVRHVKDSVTVRLIIAALVDWLSCYRISQKSRLMGEI